jgi:hypothetical protein
MFLLKTLYLQLLIISSPHCHRCVPPGPYQPALQAEHCLLCQLSFRCRKCSIAI